MNDRERFQNIMDYKPFDRMPTYYFGLWTETLQRWHSAGLNEVLSF